MNTSRTKPVSVVAMIRACVILLVVLVCAAQPLVAAPNSWPITVTDSLGRKVSLPKVPERIVLNGKALIMIADAIYLFPEAGKRIAAMSSTAQNTMSFPNAIDQWNSSKVVLENNAGPEQIAAVRPDLIILKSSVAGGLGKSVEALGVPVIYLEFETLEHYRRDLKILGQVLQDEKRATELINLFLGYVDRLGKTMGGLTDAQKPRVLLLYYTQQGGAVSFNVPPLGWMQTFMVRTGGGRPVWQDAQLGQGWTKVSLEQVAAWDPDQIYIITYTTKASDAVARLKADPQWKGLRAVKQGKLYAFPMDYYSWDQADTRWVLGMTWLATKMQPERMKSVDMMREVRDFYARFYGLDAADYARIVEPYLEGDLP